MHANIFFLMMKDLRSPTSPAKCIMHCSKLFPKKQFWVENAMLNLH